ncbi:hypothetical protein [Amycolatopsis sp. H20-H5]|uniref:hypothetical protein n=1 Tax=Amycolatopsis sp. H20-H5 TaxID=3046309 RepID=UPI002DB9BCB7|nr:hypothetical protein [Amycolatopsis sp. H20-H5]MEC3982751.1 hypothetical protein [Amycolatopsis sp. H20-H5]
MQTRTRVRAGALITAVAAATTLSTLPAEAAAAPAWAATLLPLPAGYPNASGFLTGTDGHGGYAGEFLIGDTSQVVTWTGGKPTVRGVPAGFEFASVRDENSSGVVLGYAIDYDTGHSQTFTLDGNGFHVLPVPAGYDSAYGVAINNRGDVLAQLVTDDPAKSATALWPALGNGPVVIPNAHRSEVAADLDEDGTILLNYDDHGAFLWKDGVSRDLTVPAGDQYLYASAIKNGSVVGSGATGLLWRTPDDPEALPDSDSARAVNASGLIVGRQPQPSTPYGPVAAWQGTTALGRLPMPEGYAKGSGYAVGDDGTIVGVTSNGPLDEGGVPVVWRSTLHG